MDVFSDDTGSKFKVVFYNVKQLLCNTFQLDLPKTYAYTPTCLLRPSIVALGIVPVTLMKLSYWINLMGQLGGCG